MEFEKLQQIIAEVLNVEPDEITMDTTFVDELLLKVLNLPEKKRMFPRKYIEER